MATVVAFLLGNVWRTFALALLACLGVQQLRISWAQEGEREAIASGAVALSANRTQEAMLTAMTAQRDGLLLARAADKKATDETLIEAAEMLDRQTEQLLIQHQRIRELSKLPACSQTVSMVICPAIADELRAP